MPAGSTPWRGFAATRPLLIADPFFYAVAVPAVLIAGISKGGFGGGVGLVAVPLMALAVSPVQAAAIMLPILVAMDAVGLWAYRGRWDRWNMAVLLPAAILGIGIGAASFRYLDATAVRLLLGVVAVSFSLDYYVKRWRNPEAAAQGRRPPLAKAGALGMVSGFTSFVAHAGGPPLSMVLLPQRLDTPVFVGTTVVFFAVVNFVKLFPYAWLGQFDATNLLTSAVLLPIVPAGIYSGIWLVRRVPKGVFYNIVYALVLVIGGKLVVDGVSGLL